MEPAIVAAIISGVGVVISASIAGFNGRRTQRVNARLNRELEEFRDELASRSAETDARRDYEYEARKRLYEELGPLFFQLTELSDGALSEIVRLTDPDHWRRLEMTQERRKELQQSGWIGATSYDTVVAAYSLLAPLASYRFVQRRLTVVDIALDQRVMTQWVLIRAVYESFSRDSEIASLGAPIEYQPLVADWRALRTRDPAQYWWQGVTRGRLDNAIALVASDDDGSARLLTFGEFEDVFTRAATGDDPNEKSLGAFANALFDFDPEARPVYWRLLAVQAVLHRAILRAGAHYVGLPSTEQLGCWLTFNDDLRARFDVAGAESVDDLAHVVNEYLRRNVRPALIPG